MAVWLRFRPVRRSSALLPLHLLVAVLAARAGAADFVRFLGGGRAATDCMLVTDVEGVTGGARARAARCTDGDPACDADAMPNGTCRFRVRLCVDEAVQAGCHGDVVTAAALPSPSAALAPLAAALETLPMPIAPPGACTTPVELDVAARPRPAARLVLRATATMASGHADRDRLTLVCRAAARPATFATVERRVFSRGCAMASCHGAAAAGGLALSGGTAYTSLVDVPASNAAAAAAGLRRVVPGDPGASFLLRKLTGSLDAGEGDRMPQVGAPIAPADVELVRRWIAAGAPADAAF